MTCDSTSLSLAFGLEALLAFAFGFGCPFDRLKASSRLTLLDTFFLATFFLVAFLLALRVVVDVGIVMARGLPALAQNKKMGTPRLRCPCMVEVNSGRTVGEVDALVT